VGIVGYIVERGIGTQRLQYGLLRRAGENQLGYILFYYQYGKNLQQVIST
jgi:hypothetical protein